MREKMTAGAISKIEAMDQVVIRQRITDLQLKAKYERDNESRQKELKAAVRQSRSHEGEYQLRYRLVHAAKLMLHHDFVYFSVTYC